MVPEEEVWTVAAAAVVAAADVAVTAFTQISCTNNNLTMSVSISNNGDADYPAGAGIVFYNADPEAGAATILLNSTTTNAIAQGNSTTQNFNFGCRLYLVLLSCRSVHTQQRRLPRTVAMHVRPRSRVVRRMRVRSVWRRSHLHDAVRGEDGGV